MNLRPLKRIVKRALSSAPGWRVLGPLARKPGVIVLTYHRINGRDPAFAGISIEAFTEQMEWVRAHCDPITPDAFLDRTKKPGHLRPPVLVTFDDGYRDYHDLAYPVLKRLGIPAVVFVATSFLDEGGMLWTDHVNWAVRTTKRDAVKLPWSDATFLLGSAKARDELGLEARSHLKKIPDVDRQSVLAAFLAELAAPPPGERQMLTWDEVRATMDMTTYGGHSHTHPILSRLERAAAVTEIRTCRDRIAAETDRAPTLFAYPNGGRDDFTAETKEILNDHGFTTSFATIEGIAGADTNPMEVRRLPSDDVDTPEFVWMAAGLMRSSA